jgi:hypothetical protein
MAGLVDNGNCRAETNRMLAGFSRGGLGEGCDSLGDRAVEV